MVLGSKLWYDIEIQWNQNTKPVIGSFDKTLQDQAVG